MSDDPPVPSPPPAHEATPPLAPAPLPVMPAEVWARPAPPPGGFLPVDEGSIRRGVGILCLLHLLQIPLAVVAGIIWLALSQLIYAVPAVLHYRKLGETKTVQGIWWGVGVSALLNLACWGAVLASLSSSSFH